jgi:hypothetical protein
MRNNNPRATPLDTARVPKYFHSRLNLAHHQYIHNISHTEHKFLSIHSQLHVSAFIESHHQTFYKRCYRKQLYTALRYELHLNAIGLQTPL